MDVRKKLVELIAQKVCDTWSESCDQWLPHDCGKCYANDCHISEIADHLISNGVTAQEWIPAGEPPKKITNKVIVLCKNGYMGYGHYEDYKGERTWYNLESGKPFTDFDLEGCESYEVTHWMPLPKPPKES